MQAWFFDNDKDNFKTQEPVEGITCVHTPKGITPTIMETYTAKRAKHYSIQHVFLDWDGTLASHDEGIPEKYVVAGWTCSEIDNELIGDKRVEKRRMALRKWIESFVRYGIYPYILTSNPTDDETFEHILTCLCGTISREYWQEVGSPIPQEYGGMGPEFTRRNIVHSVDKLNTIKNCFLQN